VLLLAIARTGGLGCFLLASLLLLQTHHLCVVLLTLLECIPFAVLALVELLQALACSLTVAFSLVTAYGSCWSKSKWSEGSKNNGRVRAGKRNGKLGSQKHWPSW